jgi:hypothetical protein
MRITETSGVTTQKTGTVPIWFEDLEQAYYRLKREREKRSSKCICVFKPPSLTADTFLVHEKGTYPLDRKELGKTTPLSKKILFFEAWGERLALLALEAMRSPSSSPPQIDLQAQ